MNVTRFLDLTFSGIALIVLTPLLLAVSFILRLTGEGEIFYLQQRVGFSGAPFDLLKFATMLKDSPNMGTGFITIEGDSRVLPFGKILRLTKVNELPQLINVLKGDMSLIGPRPLVAENFEAYRDDVRRLVKSVRPGLSGIGSVVFRDEEGILSGRNDPRAFYRDVIAPYKGDLEAWFANNQSLGVYVSLVLLTIWVIIFPKSRIVWRVFQDLPDPPKELSEYIG